MNNEELKNEEIEELLEMQDDFNILDLLEELEEIDWFIMSLAKGTFLMQIFLLYAIINRNEVDFNA